METIVHLTEEQARKFVEFQANYKEFSIFQEYQETFKVMLKGGVFSLKNGKAICNFNKRGQIANIEVQYHTYRLPVIS